MKMMTRWLALLATLTSATLISAAAAKLTCTLTGQELTKCCCVPQKDGKLLCTMTKETIDKCCCKDVAATLEL